VAKNWKQTATSGGSLPHGISTISIEMVYWAREKVYLRHYANLTSCFLHGFPQSLQVNGRIAQGIMLIVRLLSAADTAAAALIIQDGEHLLCSLPQNNNMLSVMIYWLYIPNLGPFIDRHTPQLSI
jgi:hypothetical protein